MTRELARALLTRWSAKLDALYDAAAAEPDTAARDRLLAQAEAIEACDMDLRRSVRGAL